jgi:Zn-dependent M16 (insulinase) family peptidase
MSYRDPNLINTLNTYDAAAEHVLEADITSEDILQGIIGTIGDLDGPLTPDQKGYASFMQYLTGETTQERQTRRSEILSSSQRDFQGFAERLRTLRDTGLVVTVGSASALEQGNTELAEGKKMRIQPAFGGEIKN